MVKRYGEGMMDEGLVYDPEGEYVMHSEYLSLQAALREALIMWEIFMSDALEGKDDSVNKGRIKELRKQFLDI